MTHGVGVAGDQVIERTAALKLGAKFRRAHGVGASAGDLDHAVPRGPVIAEADAVPDNALPPDRGDFDHASVSHHASHRADPAHRKEHRVNGFAITMEIAFEREVGGSEQRLETRIVVGR